MTQLVFLSDETYAPGRPHPKHKRLVEDLDYSQNKPTPTSPIEETYHFGVASSADKPHSTDELLKVHAGTLLISLVLRLFVIGLLLAIWLGFSKMISARQRYLLIWWVHFVAAVPVKIGIPPLGQPWVGKWLGLSIRDSWYLLTLTSGLAGIVWFWETLLKPKGGTLPSSATLIWIIAFCGLNGFVLFYHEFEIGGEPDRATRSIFHIARSIRSY